MAVSVLANTIAMPDRRAAVEKAVVEGIGDRPGEDWRVRIIEPQDRPDYIVTIEGHNNFRWKRDFFGPDEQTPEFIRKAVMEATKRPPPIDADPILERLLLKSQEGKVAWQKARALDEFVSVFEAPPSQSFALVIQKIEGSYVLRMKDWEGNEILSVTEEQQIVFGRWETQVRFERLREIYELARRKALDVDKKVADVAELLQKI